MTNSALLHDGAERLAGLGYEIQTAQANHFLGLAHLRSGHRAAARVTLQAAAAAATPELGYVVGWAAMMTDALVRVTSSSDSRLTATEHAVAVRVQAGLRNKEITAELFIIESTVEAHLTRTYRKLGLRGRSELAGRILPGG